MSKIFYSTAWKNGGLKKIKHIIQGIKEGNSDNENKKEGLVFYQFGKYLTKTVGEPIIDQHVLRAFDIFQTDINDDNAITKSRKLETINKNHKGLIRNYKNWLKSNIINDSLRKETDYAYHIDKILLLIIPILNKLKNNIRIHGYLFICFHFYTWLTSGNGIYIKSLSAA